MNRFLTIRTKSRTYRKKAVHINKNFWTALKQRREIHEPISAPKGATKVERQISRPSDGDRPFRQLLLQKRIMALHDSVSAHFDWNRTSWLTRGPPICLSFLIKLPLEINEVKMSDFIRGASRVLGVFVLVSYDFTLVGGLVDSFLNTDCAAFWHLPYVNCRMSIVIS